MMYWLAARLYWKRWSRLCVLANADFCRKLHLIIAQSITQQSLGERSLATQLMFVNHTSIVLLALDWRANDSQPPLMIRVAGAHCSHISQCSVVFHWLAQLFFTDISVIFHSFISCISLTYQLLFALFTHFLAHITYHFAVITYISHLSVIFFRYNSLIVSDIISEERKW